MKKKCIHETNYFKNVQIGVRTKTESLVDMIVRQIVDNRYRSTNKKDLYGTKIRIIVIITSRPVIVENKSRQIYIVETLY